MKRVVVVILFTVALLAIGILIGRRKIFVEIAIFASVYIALLALFGKGGAKLAIGAMVGGVVGSAVGQRVGVPLYRGVSSFLDSLSQPVSGSSTAKSSTAQRVEVERDESTS